MSTHFSKQHYTPQKIAQIKARLVAGDTNAAIARTLKVGIETVRQVGRGVERAKWSGAPDPPGWADYLARKGQITVKRSGANRIGANCQMSPEEIMDELFAADGDFAEIGQMLRGA